jgi:SAM-dependent methyltransferase
VLEEIPVLKHDPHAEAAILAIERGEPARALGSVLAATHSTAADRFLGRVRAYLLRGSIVPPIAATRLAARLSFERAAASFRSQNHELFGRKPWGTPATAEYFRLRRSDPTFVAAEAVIGALLPPGGAVLDLACGAGHLTASLGRLAEGRLVVGLDDLFPALLLARRFVSPDAALLCADAGAPLPFSDGVFGMVVCSDAYCDLPHLPMAAREMARVLARKTGVACLPHLHNDAAPHLYSGRQPLRPEEYAAVLVPLDVRLADEREVLGAALGTGRRSVAFAVDSAAVATAPDLVAVGGDGAPQEIAFDGPVLPVAVGPVVWNPLYESRAVDAARGVSVRVRSSFRYTSESEAGPFPGLLPERVRIPEALNEPSTATDEASDVFRALLAQRVAVTLPAGMLERDLLPVAHLGKRRRPPDE